MKKDRNYENITEKEWKEVYDKTEKKIRKTAKTIAVIVAVIFIIIAVFWVSIVYVRDYKVTEAATSESPDGKYELILQAVGEAEWPFGSADGRIVLMEGARQVSEVGFTIYDDGGYVRESVWKVTWYEDFVEVILSGDEQQDEQILLYFDGKKERRQLSDSGNDTYEGTKSETILPQPYVKYIEVLNQIMTEHTDPNGRVYNVEQNSGQFENNCFAILDIDKDGSQELIFNFNTSNMAGMYEVIYAYDEESDTLREEYSGWVDTAYYGNGLIRVSDSHNHGKDPEERGIWPYTLYRYDEASDCYQIQYYVESWDGQMYDDDFPKELDLDGDDILYCITEEETTESVQRHLFDREEYETWAAETMPEWARIEVVYHSMTEEEIEGIRKAYEQAAVYAAHADEEKPEDADKPIDRK